MVEGMEMRSILTVHLIISFVYSAATYPAACAYNVFTFCNTGPRRRLLNCMPRELWASDAVPPLLADLLAQVAVDEVFATIWPPFRPMVLPFIGSIRPDTAALLSSAEQLKSAAQASEETASQAAGLKVRPSGCSAWLDRLRASLPSLGSMDEPESFLQRAVQGLVMCASCPVDNGVVPSVEAAQLAVQLLRHGAEAVRDATYSALTAACDAWVDCQGDAQRVSAEYSGAIDLLSEPVALEQLVVGGLAGVRHRLQVGKAAAVWNGLGLLSLSLLG